MLSPLRTILADPGLRLTAILLFLFGCVICSVVPYQSVVGIEHFGLTHSSYALLLAGAAVVGVAAALTTGILSDHHVERRHVAAASLAIYITAGLAVTLFPGKGSFIYAHLIAFPVGGTIWPQSFALARLSARRYGPRAEGAIMSSIRAVFALPFVLVLPLWALAFRLGVGLTSVYALSFGLSILMLALILWAWPRGIEDDWAEDRGAAPGLIQSLRSFGDPALLLRVALLGAVGGLTGLYMALTGLTFTAAGRGPGDIGWFAGGVAGAEVPFMLALALVQHRVRRERLIALGTAIYAMHVALLPFLAGSSLVWLLILPASLGGAMILTLPIAYLQDLMADRPGAGSSLMSLQRIMADACTALAFALGTALAGYGLAALIGVGLALAAAAILWRIDRADAGHRFL